MLKKQPGKSSPESVKAFLYVSPSPVVGVELPDYHFFRSFCLPGPAEEDPLDDDDFAGCILEKMIPVPHFLICFAFSLCEESS